MPMPWLKEAEAPDPDPPRSLRLAAPAAGNPAPAAAAAAAAEPPVPVPVGVMVAGGRDIGDGVENAAATPMPHAAAAKARLFGCRGVVAVDVEDELDMGNSGDEVVVPLPLPLPPSPPPPPRLCVGGE